MALIALAGNPNSGKTTLFNSVTGLNYKVANYPGVTVERKEGEVLLPGGGRATLVDLPGIYSLSGLSLDERIATKQLLGTSGGDRPDIVIQVVDATNLERNLLLLSQLLDCGVKVVVALSMVDLARNSGVTIHKELLERKLGLNVVEIIARKRVGLNELLAAVEKSLADQERPAGFSWLKGHEHFQKIITELGDQALKIQTELKGATPELIGAQLVDESWQANSFELRQLVTQTQNKLKNLGYDPLTFEASARYKWIEEVLDSTTSRESSHNKDITKKLDSILTHKIWGTVIFLIIMGALFQSIFILAQYPMDLLEGFIAKAGSVVSALFPQGQFRSLLSNGIFAGVGSVLVFVPQIAILFLLLSLLEDTGYLSRSALLMDRVLRPLGLQGRSFVPLLSSFACAIPGILSTRTIPSWPDRIATILVAPLMSCSARLPVYTVLIGAFVPPITVLGFLSLQGIVLSGMYLLGILGACIVAFLLRKTVLRGSPAHFVMEMPPYRMPIARNVFRQVLDAVKAFLKSAGSIILAITILLWFLASYPRGDAKPGESVPLETTYAGTLGQMIEPVIKPLGYNWEIGVCVIASFAAREVFVSSLATVYNLEESDDEATPLIEILKQKRQESSFSLATAASLLVFYVFACMCISTLAVCRRETGSWGWTAFMFFYMTAIGYGAAALTFALFTRFA